ncbi:MAG: hypothetical protein ABH881_01005 [bacterium]
MESNMALDAVQEIFEGMGISSARQGANALAFSQNIRREVFEGQVFTDNDFVRIGFWLSIPRGADFGDIVVGIQLANDSLKKAHKNNRWMFYAFNRKERNLTVVARIKISSRSEINIEECKRRYKEMVSHITDYITLIFL